MLCGKSHRISFRSAANANHCHVIKLRGCVRCNRWRSDGEWQQQAEEDIAALRGLIWQQPSHTGGSLLQSDVTSAEGPRVSALGFEPSRRLRACRFSRPVPSTTRPPIPWSEIKYLKGGARQNNQCLPPRPLTVSLLSGSLRPKPSSFLLSDLCFLLKAPQGWLWRALQRYRASL